MSGPALQEHSYLKVLHNFQYKTAEGREIIIKKNEPLYLLQKTNADWWQVVRTLEQRSFYVPASYVREVSKASASSTRKNSEEDRDGIFEPPQDPSYKSMPKESSNAMRNVKKWLAGAIDSKPEPPKTLYDSEAYQNSDSMDGASRSRLKVGLVEAKTKSLERDRRSGHFSDREEDAVNGSPRSRDSGEYHENHMRAVNRLSTSPKSSVLPFRMEASLQDPFRRELESSLDRRNLGVKSGAKLGPRIRTRSTNSEGSHADSDAGEARESAEKGEKIDKVDKESFLRSERRQNLSVHEESPRDSQSSSGTSRNSRSLDFETNKFSLHTERSASPKPSYGRQMTIAGGSTVYQEKNSSGDSASGDHKILNDKRRTWAVEELMSELTQMCKERVVNKKPAFQLKSTEVKANFDPLEKLTREIHEMNRLRTEGNAPDSEVSQSADASPINVCKISINSTNSLPNRADVDDAQDDSTMAQHEIANRQRVNDEQQPEESNRDRVKENRKNPGFSLREIEPVAASPKALKSPKSPKILDEYNEANILNDCNSIAGAAQQRDFTRSLSPDKQSFYQKRSNVVHSSADNIDGQCYSNVKVNAKPRPKLKIKTMEPTAELRLTPSLEKLASEIQFLPARRTSETDDGGKREFPKTSGNDEVASNVYEEGSKSDDSLERRERRGILKNFKHKLEYKGSFKTKREGKYTERERRGDGEIREIAAAKQHALQKSSSLHCATIPECYRRFRKHEMIERFEPVRENYVSFKRRSRSLSDLESFEQNIAEYESREVIHIPRAAKDKPVPLPRTKIPAVPIRRDASLGFSNIEISNSEDKIATGTKNNGERIPSRTIPEQRKISREKRDCVQDEDSWQAKKGDLSTFFSLDKFQNRPGEPNGRRNINIESSTAVGFKSLLCASDSGSDNCLQSKELLSSSTDNLNERGSSLRNARTTSFSANFNDRGKLTRESLSDEQILSSNASSEALQSHSESEVTATLDVSSQPSPVTRTAQDDFECSIDLPPGWSQKYDSDTGQICFLNDRGDKWFSSNDAEGKIYFFEENSNESSWVLPAIEARKSQSASPIVKNDKAEANGSAASEKAETGSIRSSILANPSIVGPELPPKKSGPAGGDWPHLCDGNNMLVLKEGIINRTKITENGKKLRKNWSTSYAVLTELFLLFFKDAKTFTMMKTAQSSMAKPDISVDLNGAIIEPGDRASSRKNVYMISTVLGLQVLVQSDNTAVATEWFQDVHGAIRKLPSSFKSQVKPLLPAAEVRKTSGGKQPVESNLLEEPKRFSKIARSRSMKMKRLDDSLEDLSGSAAERQTKIKAKLRRFFQRRPAVELLVKNGIYKDEPAFGSYLADVCPAEHPRVPLFVKTCIEVLESKEENMKTDGLYRASGNLSQIQKIRLQVDQYKLDVLAQEEDVHVLAGALKLFFRELKEPLIPSTFFKEAVNASMLKKSSAKIQCFREIVKALPPPNYDTLQFLLKHLLRVTSYQEFNRMHIPNLAIVFGPTLMWPAEESANMALDFMQQNLVIECLLSEYNKIFK